jgi:histidinol-phosphate aminotransferase
LRRFIKKVGPKVTVLIDEAYMELVDRPEYSSAADLVKAGDNVIVTRTFSKIYGMAGMRVGYALGNPEVMKKARGYLMSYFNNSAGLAAAIASYNDTAFLAYSKQIVADARGMIMSALKSVGLTALPSQANFVYVKVPNADTFSKAMADKKILVRGSYGKWTQYSRVSTGKIEDVKRYVAALPEIMKA